MKKITLLLSFFLLAFSNLKAQAPANDTCQGAIELSVFDNSCQTPTVVNNANATDSGVANPSCFSNGDFDKRDLWYKITVPASGIVTIETSSVNGSNITDTGMTVYAGTCDNLDEIACNDDGVGTGAFAKIELAGQTEGETLFIRVFGRYNGISGEFNICVYDPQASAATARHTIAGLSLFPNPFTKRLNVSADENIDEIHIYNITGQEVLRAHPGSSNYSFITEKLQPGIYLIKIIAGTSANTLKLIKK